MKRVKVILEGQSEREFLTRSLGPYVSEKTAHEVLLVPSVLITSVGERTHRGGHTRDYGIVKRNVSRAVAEGGGGRLLVHARRVRVSIEELPVVGHAPPGGPARVGPCHGGRISEGHR